MSHSPPPPPPHTHTHTPPPHTHHTHIHTHTHHTHTQTHTPHAHTHHTPLTTNNISIERRVTKECPQVSCCGPSIWNLLYNSIFNRQFTSHTKLIAFADDLIILTKGESIVEAENYTNLKLRKISDWAQKNKLTFNENKSKVMIMPRRIHKDKGSGNIPKL